MQNNFLQILPWAKYLLGLGVYFVFISQQQLSMAIIWFVFVVYGWTILSVIFKTYKLQDFVYILVAITSNTSSIVPIPPGRTIKASDFLYINSFLFCKVFVRYIFDIF